MKCEPSEARQTAKGSPKGELASQMQNAKCGVRNALPSRTSSFILHPSSFSSAFSLVEVLAAIAIIGIITFMAIPNIVRIKQDGEDNLARARAETINMAVASYIQAVGTNTAQSNWSGASDANARYNLVRSYIAFAESSLTAFTPSGYSFTLTNTIVPMTAKPVTVISNTSRATSIPY